MNKYITTQKELRLYFWNEFSQFKSEYRKTWTQNQYRSDIRFAFIDYVDALQKLGIISEALAKRATL